MNFEDIKPFIRYTAIIKPLAHDIEKSLKSYDNCIIYCISGKGTIRIENEKYKMTPGSVLMWRANHKYRICSSEENPEYVMINFDFVNDNAITYSFKIPPESPDIFNADRISDLTIFDDRPEFNTTIFKQSSKQLGELFLGIMSEFRNPKNHMNMRISAKMIIILSELSDAFTLETSSKAIDKSDEIVEYIHEHYTKELTNSDIAKHFNFHPQHINKIIKKKTGYSLHKYVIMRRISKAIDLLETSEMSIAEIAEKTGFQNTCHFSRYFKEFMGSSPRSYRQRIK